MESDDLTHDDPRRSAKIREEDLDRPLAALFRSIEAPAPPSDFAERTMKAVKAAPLPAGRRPLRHPLAGLMGWAALIAGVAVSSWGMAVTQPQFASAFTTLLSGGIGVGMWLMQFAGAGFALSDVLTTTGLAVTRAIVTREGSTGLVLMSVMGAVSLSALHRLLISEGEDSQWQELS